MRINLPFNKVIYLYYEDNSAIAKVNHILRKRLNEIKDSEMSRKIALIKVLREERISKILIDAHLVPKNDIREYENEGVSQHQQVGLVFAKEWIEEYFTPEELTRGDLK